MAQVLRDPPRLRDVTLTDCVIEGPLNLDGVHFAAGAEFQGVVFEGPASFADAFFEQGAGFTEATFERGAKFDRARFDEEALFQRITVGHQGATFRSAEFRSLAYFGNSIFEGAVNFTGAVFAVGGSFGQTRFGSDAYFDGATGTTMDFARARFQGDVANFNEFRAERLRLTRAVFAAQVEARLHVDVIVLTGAAFSAGASIRCAEREEGRTPSLGLERARFGASSFVAGAGATRPLLESMRYADASNLTLADITLASCQFHGAHNLDQLRLEGSAAFVESPADWRVELPWPWAQHWTPRRVLAEEVAWRVRQPARPGKWHRIVLRWPERFPLRWPSWQYTRDPAKRMRWPDWGAPGKEPEDPLTPDEIGTIYRALRKGREDHKDEPGAADFYYGEMEMRRWGSRSRNESLLDRLVLWLYWVTSGYALRASRAFVTLIVVIVVFAALFELVGFASQAIAPRAIGVTNGRIVYEDTTFPERPPINQAFRALTYSAATATAVAGAPPRRLTAIGEGLRIVLRVLGPLLLALTAVSIRGRIKR
ncbi:pentapeptide repeat-containing protein [Solirubrobacter soli]|uniref:pentapeptide repeat-containing protein n=1 Tax=Solirubrobacter soli TaxID=363832 RepID=UPI0003F98560|nr:pentapeptide repeat-containing protein [Solirubrobacter soli]